jgi:ACDE family multidrug resistance protein
MDQIADTRRLASDRVVVSDLYRGPLAISFATSIAVVSGAMMLYPVLPVIAGDLAVDESRIGLVMVAFTAPAIVLAPLFGVLADLYGRRWLLILGLALFGLAGGAASLAPSYDWLLALRALQGVGMSALTPLTIVLISDLLTQEGEIQGQGIKVALDRVAMIALPIGGGALAMLSWRAAFVPYLIVVLLALAAWTFMPETGRPGSDSLRSYLARTSRAIREPRLTLAFATGFLRFFLDYGLFTYLPLLVALRYGATPTMSGLLIAVSAVGSIVTAVTIDRIFGKVRTEWLLMLAFLASALGLAIVALGAPLWAIAVAVFAFGLGNGWISPLQKSLMTRRTPPELRGGVIAVDRVIQQVA